MRMIAWIAFAIVAFLALVLGGLALWNQHLIRVAEREFPPIGRFVTVEGVRLHYIDHGKGPALLLIHGANGTLQDWTQGLAQRLESHFRVIAFDRPGHGYSERPENEPASPAVQARLLHGAMMQLGVEKPIVVGFSWGGAVAAAYGLAFPKDAAAVVSLAGALYPWQAPIDRIYDLPTYPIIGPLIVHTMVMPLGQRLAPEWVKSAFAPEPVAQAFAGAPLSLVMRPSEFVNNAEERRLLKGFLKQQSRNYAGFKPPLVLVTGDADTVVSPRIHTFPMHEAVPGSDLIVVPGAGHMLPFNHPQRVVEAIDRAHALALARGN